ncbi:hypothetical protein GTY54_49290, partial [Streptomyces sp. SID625]|nr:hypothetical protein [Streptomyces sp. SID625]
TAPGAGDKLADAGRDPDASAGTGTKGGPADGTAQDAATTYAEPDWRKAAVEKFGIGGGGEEGPLTITPPGESRPALTVHQVPHDGASFFHALIAAAGHHGRLPPLLGTTTAGRTGVSSSASPADLVESARGRLVDAL